MDDVSRDDSTVWQRLRGLLGGPAAADLSLEHQLVAAIGEREPELEQLTTDELRRRGLGARARVQVDGDDEAVVVDIFALTREGARRALGERLFDEQILAGLALHRATVVEMQTGEGKTLAAVAPVAVSALAGHGVHVLTFNDYLARRDAEWMRPVYELIGLTVGCIQPGMTTAQRRHAYGCDVTYATAKEAGFDLLRDSLALEPGDRVHRLLHDAIVDEADSILIDEARVPLVIAGAVKDNGRDLGHLAALARRLRIGSDYDVGALGREVNLTEAGAGRVERELGCGNLFASHNLGLLGEVRNALHAEALLRRDADYIVRDERIELVDELTGRVVEDRQWPDGLQAALEAKEGLRRQADGKILGSITMQHFLRGYRRLAGMTATATSAAAELAETYGLEVAVIPTNRPGIRIDRPDMIFTHKEAKTRAVEREIRAVHARRRPVLVGTASVAESEELAARLRRSAIPCQVLNARHDEREAEIVAGAGVLGAVTISTNMAGRGTDIRLGGANEANYEAVAALGGLYVIGTNRHESRRIDDQLRGRAGRQGDPGESRFFVSLEDDLLERVGISELIPSGWVPARSDDPVDDALVRREIARAQRVADGDNAAMRKTLWRYAQVVDGQRRCLQQWRCEVMDGAGFPSILKQRCGDRYERVRAEVGPAVLESVERRLTLLAIDRWWSDYLAEIARIRDGIHLVALGRLQPYDEFHNRARAAFDVTLDRIEEDIASTFETTEITAAGIDWEREGLAGPSSTWTYIVSDTPFQLDPLAVMASHQTIGLNLAVLYAPLWMAWGVFRSLKRWYRSRAAGHRGHGAVSRAGWSPKTR